MSLNLYQKAATETAIYPGATSYGDEAHKLKMGCIVYTALGLAGEAGEFANQVKKAIRDDGGVPSDERYEKLIDELGDTLWYVAMAAHELGLKLDYVATRNIDKLRQRHGG